MQIIDSDDYKASGIETLFFPGGEPHVKIPVFKETLLLWLKLRTWADVGFAALVQNAMLHQGVPFKAFIPYFPGARQDRTDGLAPFTMKIMADLLYNRKTSVFDPHSSELTDYMPFKAYMPSSLPVSVNKDVVGIIAPDEGAEDRAKDFLDKFYPNADLLRGYKVRNPQTGALSHYELEEPTKPGTYIIIDDICDGGGTFNLLVQCFDTYSIAKECKLEMFVSHGIFSRGLGNISPRIERVTTTDSWCQVSTLNGLKYMNGGAWPDPDRLTVIPLLPALLEKLSA